jgi:hypothetical protein
VGSGERREREKPPGETRGQESEEIFLFPLKNLKMVSVLLPVLARWCHGPTLAKVSPEPLCESILAHLCFHAFFKFEL